MHPPPSIVLPGLTDDQVLHLKVSLYGLKQAGWWWYGVLRELLGEFRLTRCELNHAVFSRHHTSGDISIVFVHMDDMSITSSNPSHLHQLKDKISACLKITDNGPLHWLLSIQVSWTN